MYPKNFNVAVVIANETLIEVCYHIKGKSGVYPNESMVKYINNVDSKTWVRLVDLWDDVTVGTQHEGIRLWMRRVVRDANNR